MNSQLPIPGTPSVKAKVNSKKLPSLLMEMGGQSALLLLEKELTDMQKQHPSAVGLTLALALTGRRIAELKMEVSRTILSAAAQGGLQIEGNAIMSSLVDGELVIESVPGEPS